MLRVCILRCPETPCAVASQIWLNLSRVRFNCQVQNTVHVLQHAVHLLLPAHGQLPHEANAFPGQWMCAFISPALSFILLTLRAGHSVCGMRRKISRWLGETVLGETVLMVARELNPFRLFPEMKHLLVGSTCASYSRYLGFETRPEDWD
jgi:hypothetical protein